MSKWYLISGKTVKQITEDLKNACGAELTSERLITHAQYKLDSGLHKTEVMPVEMGEPVKDSDCGTKHKTEMSVDEFQKEYHNYMVKTKEEALEDIKNIMVKGHSIRAVTFSPMKWCLMVDAAVDALIEIGILGPDNF